jgi:hypothetical protein
MLKKPMTMARIPEARSRRQKGIPRDFWLVACLFILPSWLRPITIIAQPSVMNPCAGLRSGQLRAKKPLKSEHSETMRNKPAIAVTTWLVASKKKNCSSSVFTPPLNLMLLLTLEITKVLTSMTMLLATTDARAMIFRPRRMFKIM